MLGDVLNALVDEIASASHTWLPESLHAGLLEILFTSQHRSSKTFSYPLLSTIRYSWSLESPLHEFAIAIRYSVTTLLAPWECLVALVESRLPILDRYNSGACRVRRPCDNLENMPTCRLVQWTQANMYAPTRFMPDEITEFIHISQRNRSFLRVIAYQESAMRSDEVAQKLLLFMLQHPGQVPCITIDLIAGTCAIDVWRRDRFVPQFELDMERIVGSAGQLQLSLIRVKDEDQNDRLIWPCLDNDEISTKHNLPRILNRWRHTQRHNRDFGHGSDKGFRLSLETVSEIRGATKVVEVEVTSPTWRHSVEVEVTSGSLPPVAAIGVTSLPVVPPWWHRS
ncbi:hypothetical protein C8R45DRAFT_931554 [Mycena sanguinolenta]|nr:hypothetical protein C8R45DRAFT_931554 [Mycena sanguinolenta]